MIRDEGLPMRVHGLIPAPPARAGDALNAVDTPALLLDLDRFEANLAALHGTPLAHGVSIRPHGKAHKCSQIAARQIAAGAAGICCQKVSEAEVFVDSGIGDVLVTNQVATAGKASRLARLATRARIGVCVDDVAQVELIGVAALASSALVDVLIEVDVGGRRCGVAGPAEAMALARAVGQHAGLRLRGLHAYHGRAQHLRDPLAREDAIAEAARLAAAVRDALLASGFPCDVVTGGGTGSYRFEAASGVYTEIQPGSYVLMDTDYLANTPMDGDPQFAPALTVLCSVVSRHEGRVVLDGGLKAFAVDSGLPRIDRPGWTVRGLSDEHAVVELAPGVLAPGIGEKVAVMPSHCDPTVNLHDWLIAVRGTRVEAAWRVDARGALA